MGQLYCKERRQSSFPLPAKPSPPSQPLQLSAPSCFSTRLSAEEFYKKHWETSQHRSSRRTRKFLSYVLVCSKSAWYKIHRGGHQAMCLYYEWWDKISQSLFPFQDKECARSSCFWSFLAHHNLLPSGDDQKGEIDEYLFIPRDSVSSPSFTTHHDSPSHVYFFLYDRIDVFYTELYYEQSSKQLHVMGLILCKWTIFCSRGQAQNVIVTFSFGKDYLFSQAGNKGL